MPIDAEKLAKLQKNSAKKVGGTRIKVKKNVVKGEQDDVKLQQTLKKLNAITVENVDEANFFKEDGKVLHFKRVSVQSAAANNTFAFTGIPQDKNITELVPKILPQLGAENLDILAKLAQELQAKGGLGGLSEQVEGGEDIPDLVEGETFDDVE